MTIHTANARSLAAAGIPFADAHWFLTVAKPRGFKGRTDVARAQAIVDRASVSMKPTVH